MKKFAVIGITVIFALCSFASCEENLFIPKASTGKTENALRLIPKDAIAVFFIDIHRVMTIEFVDKIIKEKENDEIFNEFTGFQEFKAKTGIDPQKDIYFIVGALTGKMEKDKEEGVGIINLKYNKDLFLSTIKEAVGEEEEEEEKEEEEEEHAEEEEEETHELIEEEYNGFNIYTVKEEDEEGSFSFIDESNIAVGDEDSIKSVIDVLQKKKENFFKNEELSALLTKINKETIFWGAVLTPPEAINKIKSEIPQLSALEAVNAASISFDYKNKNIIAEIKLMSSDPMKNQELADGLNGFKSMFAMVQIQDLTLGEILDKIEITSGPDHVKIYASFPEDLPKDIIDKLKMEKPKEEKEKIQ